MHDLDAIKKIVAELKIKKALYGAITETQIRSVVSKYTEDLETLSKVP